MSRKAGLILASIVAALLLGLYVASPLFAFKALAQAGESGDRAALAKLVDFEAVRADLKVQLQQRLMGALSTDESLNRGPFGALGALLGPSIVNQVVDTAITPEGVAAIVKSGRAPLADTGGALSPPAQISAEPAPTADETKEKKTRFAYAGLNRFRAVITAGGSPPLGWVMERRGVFGWKLVQIELPPA